MEETMSTGGPPERFAPAQGGPVRSVVEADHVRSASSDWEPGVSPAVVLSVAVGGVLGALARYLVEMGVATPHGHFPWATLLVNVSGSAVLGALLVWIRRRLPRHRLLRPFLGTGIIGAYTTFSTFAVEADELVRGGHVLTASLYVVVSLVAGLGAALAGIAAARRWIPFPGRMATPMVQPR
jgi:CrcB protein